VILAEYVQHYNGRRPHRTRDLRHHGQPIPWSTSARNGSSVTQFLGA
jgi:hypothetical protein